MSIALALAGIILGFSSAIVHRVQKVFESKSKKHEKIKILAESKLDSVSSLISKATEDANISHQEYKFILKEVEHYRTLKEKIRTRSKHAVDAITNEQRKAIFLEGKKQGKEDFLKQVAHTSAIQP
ncbi:hypothetical protein, partial [Acinetobacter baumannii]|uniref:hypothetical protein n=1 Tax=Acinetobacter baumannii TaxID=470 RepID=UPI001C07A61D